MFSLQYCVFTSFLGDSYEKHWVMEIAVYGVEKLGRAATGAMWALEPANLGLEFVLCLLAAVT